MSYTLINGTIVYPAQVPSQTITLTADIILSWPNSPSTSTIAAGFNKVIPNANDWTIALPDATLATIGVDIIFYNNSSFSFLVSNNIGTTLAVLNPGDMVDFKLDNSSTVAGQWLILPFLGGFTGIVSFLLESLDNSIIITNGDVTNPGGTVNFSLPESISNINKVSQTGFAYITDTSPLTWNAVDMLAGSNILITENGSGDLIFNTTSDITNLTSLEVGDLYITGSTINTNNTDIDINITTYETGVINLNGVVIGKDGNTIISNLTVLDTFENPFTPKAWCVFTYISGLITIEDGANIDSIVPIIDGTGSYILYFTDPMPNINYGINISFGTNGGSAPLVVRGSWTTRDLDSFVISVFDDSGELMPTLPYGATVIVMSS